METRTGGIIRGSLQAVRTSALFEGLDAKTVNSIVDQGHISSYNPREIICRQGHPPSDILLVDKGLALMSKTTSTGAQLLLGWLRPGDGYGLVSLLEDSQTYLATVEAFSEVEVLRWPRPTFRSMTRQHPPLMENVLRYVFRWLRASIERLQLFASETVERRLAILLCQSAEQVGTEMQGGIELCFSDEQLAQIAGTTLFSVSRLLQCWERSDLLRKTRGRILIHEGVNVPQLIEAAAKLRLPGANNEQIRKTAT